MGINWLVIVFAAALVLLLGLHSRAVSPRASSIEPAVIEAFRAARRRQWLMSVPLAVLVMFLQWHRVHSSTGAGMDSILLLLAVAVAALFTYRNWRCPNCGAYLGKYPLYRGVCPKCGAALREQTK
ncbi:MAG: hypothetical protein ABIU96_06320 [Rhodanobacter sp.]